MGSHLALARLWGSPVSGASMNPARSLGPALVLGAWTSWRAYLIGPVADGVIAVGFGAADLALDMVGARQIFANVQVSLTLEQATAVTERPEGWLAGPYLAALITSESHGQEPAVTGDDGYVADYLYREGLIRQPEYVQRFLRRPAVLDQLYGPLCDAMLWPSGAAGQLRRLEAVGLFVIPWTASGTGTGTTRCSGSSCSANSAASNPASSRRCTGEPPTGIRPTNPRRSPWSVSWTRPTGTVRCGSRPPWPSRHTTPGSCRPFSSVRSM